MKRCKHFPPRPTKTNNKTHQDQPRSRLCSNLQPGRCKLHILLDLKFTMHAPQLANPGLQHIMINVCRVSSWGHRHIPILKMDHTYDFTFSKNVRKNPHDVSSRFPPCHQIICPLCVLAIICCHLCVSSLSGLCSVCHQVCSLSPTQVAFVDIFTQAVCLFPHGMCSWTHPMIPSVVIANM